MFDAAYAYMGFIRDLGPHNNTASTEGQQLSAATKEAMSRPLTGEEAKLANSPASRARRKWRPGRWDLAVRTRLSTVTFAFGRAYWVFQSAT